MTGVQTCALPISLTQEWQSLWVDVCPREKQEPGRYVIAFCLAEEGGSDAECRAEVRVIGGELPPLPILHTEWFHCDGIVDYYGVEAFSGEFWRIFRNFVRVYVKRGGNMMYVPVLTPPLDTEVGLERTTIQLVRVERKGREQDPSAGEARHAGERHPGGGPVLPLPQREADL